MYSLSVKNEQERILQLTNNQNYSVISITGLNPPTATINTSTMPNFDGATYNSARVNTRNIVITIIPEAPVESNRVALYKFFKTKHWCRLFYKNNQRDVYIDGYVETMEFDAFSQKQQIQISILCPRPYFVGIVDAKSTLDRVVPLFELPVSIPSEGVELSKYCENEPLKVLNRGDVDAGMIFTFSFAGNTKKLTIRDKYTKQLFSVEYDFQPYDTLKIDTNRGNKSVTLLRNSQELNLINYMTVDSVWLQAGIGENELEVRADQGIEKIEAAVEWMNLYEGV